MTQVPPPAGYNPAPQKPAGMAIASMILGIISLVLFCVWWLAIPCGIVAIILGVVANKKIKTGEAGGAGMAKAGVICGIIAVVLSLLITILAVVGISLFGDKLKELQRQQQLQTQSAY